MTAADPVVPPPAGTAAGDVVTTTLSSPVGDLRLVADAGGLCGLFLDGHRPPPPAWCCAGREVDRATCASFVAAADALERYFGGDPRPAGAGLVLSLRGTPFQLALWARLAKIPFGTTTTYAELAAALGRPRSVRAVGAANARNPVSILVPCHRVIGSDGSLTGYAGGLERKRFLLAHEGAIPPLVPS